jgi:hypothetical protein
MPDHRPILNAASHRCANWLEAVFPFPGSPRAVDRFSHLWRAQGCPAELALFGRITAGYGQQVYLLTPGAACLAAALPGSWTDAGDPTALGRSLQVGRCEARLVFGLAHETLDSRAS